MFGGGATIAATRTAAAGDPSAICTCPVITGCRTTPAACNIRVTINAHRSTHCPPLGPDQPEDSISRRTAGAASVARLQPQAHSGALPRRAELEARFAADVAVLRQANHLFPGREIADRHRRDSPADAIHGHPCPDWSGGDHEAWGGRR